MGKMLRPKADVLQESALIPTENRISHPPNQFTHELTRAQPFYYSGAPRGRPPAGEFVAGTKVVLLVHLGGKYCRVADHQGLYVETEHGGLRPL